MTDYNSELYEKLKELLTELNDKLDTTDLSFTGTDLDVNIAASANVPARYIWQYRDMFKSSADSDIIIRITFDSWMQLLDSTIHAEDFAGNRTCLVRYRDYSDENISIIGRQLLDDNTMQFPTKEVTEDVALSTTEHRQGTFTEPFIMYKPDRFQIAVYSTVTGEEITVILRGILPSATPPTINVTAGVYGAVNTYDYNDVTLII